MYISKEQMNEIQAIFNQCYFLDQKKRERFWKRLLRTTCANSLDRIDARDFTLAKRVATEMLHDEGRSVFKPASNYRLYKTF